MTGDARHSAIPVGSLAVGVLLFVATLYYIKIGELSSLAAVAAVGAAGAGAALALVRLRALFWAGLGLAIYPRAVRPPVDRAVRGESRAPTGTMARAVARPRVRRLAHPPLIA